MIRGLRLVIAWGRHQPQLGSAHRMLCLALHCLESGLTLKIKRLYLAELYLELKLPRKDLKRSIWNTQGNLAKTRMPKKITDGDKGAEEAAGYIIDLLGEGYMPDQIEIGVTGKASDENIITVEKPHGDDAGFGTEEPKNEELADKRAEAVRDRILEILKQETGIDFSNSIELDGVEVQDAALAEEIGNIAANKNMSLYDFVDTYNSGDRGSLGLNAEEQEVMSRLEANRGADIDVSATREVVEELPDTVTIERKGSLVIIAIFIPPFLFRIRLRKPEEEADPAPVPTPEPNPVEPWYVGKTKLVDPKAKARSGYGSATYHNKQPTTLNQGSRRQGSTSVNRRGRK